MLNPPLRWVVREVVKGHLQFKNARHTFIFTSSLTSDGETLKIVLWVPPSPMVEDVKMNVNLDVFVALFFTIWYLGVKKGNKELACQVLI